MLVLSRKKGQEITIGDSIKVKVLDSKRSRVALGISAPEDVSIRREESRHLDTDTVTPASNEEMMTQVLVVANSRVERCLAGGLIGSQPNVKVIFADNGRSALAKIRQHKPDLIVTDLIMPKMNGLELLRASRREFPSIPVIPMTARGNESLAVDALNDGAASYVPKAKRSERLVETIQRVLARAQAERTGVDELNRCSAQLNATFCLENDPKWIPPIVDYVQQMIAGLELSDQTERIRACVALEEALLNAMCHGNLELSTDDLDQVRADGRNRLNEMIARRRLQPPYRDRKILLEISVNKQTARFVIRDSGQGFDQASTYQAMQRDCFDKGAGSGVALMNMLMDKVSYNDNGNELTLVKVCDN